MAVVMTIQCAQGGSQLPHGLQGVYVEAGA